MEMTLAVVFMLVRILATVVEHGFDPDPGKEEPMFRSIFNDDVPICRICVYAHIVSGYKGDSKTFCCFGGPVRAIEFAVSDCTDFRDKTVPERHNVAGFVRNIRPAE